MYCLELSNSVKSIKRKNVHSLTSLKMIFVNPKEKYHYRNPILLIQYRVKSTTKSKLINNEFGFETTHFQSTRGVVI